MTPVLLALFLSLPLAASEITRENVLAQMNAHRAERGLLPLQENACLDAAAESRMREMEDLGYWAHESPDGRSPFRWLAAHGYSHRYAAENLATGFETAEVMVSAWMESDGHRENIVSPLYDECGIAVIDGATRGRAAGRSVVVLFARAAEAAPSSAVVPHDARLRDAGDPGTSSRRGNEAGRRNP